MSNLIKGKKHDWETVIGLEIHAQVKSNSKLFSSSSTAFGSKPNSQVSLVDAAMPGMLPVINKYCIEQAIKTGIGRGTVKSTHAGFKIPHHDGGAFDTGFGSNIIQAECIRHCYVR